MEREVKSKQGWRVAWIGIVVEERNASAALNSLLHEYGDYILGRMGVPYRQRGFSIISVILDAPADVISALSGKLGMIPYVTTKTVYAKLPEESGKRDSAIR